MSWDEATQREHAKVALDFINEHLDLGHEPMRPQSKLMNHPARHYGLWFTISCFGLEQLLGLEDDFHGRYLMRHILVFLLFWFATIVFYKLLKWRFDDWKIALLGVLMLIVSPRIFAHSFFNPKDMVLLPLYVISTYSMLRFLDKPILKYALIHGFACAFVVNARMPGMIIPVLTVFWFLLNKFQKFNKKKNPPIENSATNQNLKTWRNFSIFLVITLLLTIALSPAYWGNPVKNVSDTFNSLSNYEWGGIVLYFGEWIKAMELPWHYVPVWIGITTPVIYLLFFILGSIFTLVLLIKNFRQFQIFKNKNDLTDLSLLALAILPILVVIIKNSTLYDGWRQLYFVYPCIVGLAVVGFVKILNLIKKSSGLDILQKPAKWLVGGTLIFSIFYTSIRMIQDHPHQYVYFNWLAGENITERFEMDYWGLSYKQALEELIERYPNSGITIKAANYPGEENYRFIKEKVMPHLVLKYGPAPGEYYISNYRGSKELQYFKEKLPPYDEEVFSIEVGGNKIIGVYKNRNYTIEE